MHVYLSVNACLCMFTCISFPRSAGRVPPIPRFWRRPRKDGQSDSLQRPRSPGAPTDSIDEKAKALPFDEGSLLATLILMRDMTPSSSRKAIAEQKVDLGRGRDEAAACSFLSLFP